MSKSKDMSSIEFSKLTFRPIDTPIDTINNYNTQINISSFEISRLTFNFLDIEEKIQNLKKTNNFLPIFLVIEENLVRKLISIYKDILAENKQKLLLETERNDYIIRTSSFVETYLELKSVPARYPIK
jgi:hypothetical protein